MSEKSGKAVSYYLVQVDNPNQGDKPYQAECGDIIEALGMTFNEGCAFKAIWRSAAARSLGKHKEGGDALYDAEKVVFYGERMVSQLEYAMVKKQVADIQANAKVDAEITVGWPILDTDTLGQKLLFPAHHIASAEGVKVDSLPPGAYMQINEHGIVTGMVFHGPGLNEPSEAMKQAMQGGVSDSACPYLCFPNNVCNKCGDAHDGKAFKI